MATNQTTDPVYDERETLGPQLNVANWVLTGISLIFLLLRLYCKAIQRRGLWWDDHFLTASWVTLLLSSSFQVVSVSNGYGHHVTALSPEQKQATTFYYMIASTFLITASAWSKTSFAITLLRITDHKTNKFIWFLIISMNLTKLVSAMLQWISCQPIEKSWNTMYVGGSCWEKMPIAYYNLFSGAYSGFADVILALLPWKVILALQMKRREKIGVAVAMSMGVFAGITAFVKCAKIPTLFGGDFTYEGCELIIWGSAETAATIMAASIPVLRVLIREIKHDEKRGAGGGGGLGGYGYYGRSRGGVGGIGGRPGSPGSAGRQNLMFSLKSPVMSASSRRGDDITTTTINDEVTESSIHRHHTQHSTVVTVTGGRKHHNHLPPTSPKVGQAPTVGMGGGGGGGDEDESSDKSILNNDSSFDVSNPTPRRHPSVKSGRGGHGGIMQTNEVSIDYENSYIMDEKMLDPDGRVNRMV